MIHATKRIAGGAGLAPWVLVKRAPTLELDWDTRSKGRFSATDSDGREIGVVLPRGTSLRGGDDNAGGRDGSLVRVLAAAQPVLQVRHCAEHGSPVDLLRAATTWATAMLPLELQANLLQFEPDPVLAEMLRRQHLIVTGRRRPFEAKAVPMAKGQAMVTTMDTTTTTRMKRPATSTAPAAVTTMATTTPMTTLTVTRTTTVMSTALAASMTRTTEPAALLHLLWLASPARRWGLQLPRAWRPPSRPARCATKPRPRGGC